MEVALGYFEDDDSFDINEDTFDFSKPATSGIEYLKRVQQEAAACEEVVVASGIDRTELLTRQTVNVNTKDALQPAPAEYLPDERWQLHQASNFAVLRQTFLRHKSNGNVHDEKSKSMILPRLHNREEWCAFCFGPDFLEKCSKSRINSISEAEVLRREQITSVYSEAHSPLLSIMLKINQPMAVVLLDFHLDWFGKLGLSPEQGEWFYALLVCLDKPTPPEAICLLRNLARKCALLRASLNNIDDTILPHLNLLITIVTRYFEQSDLLAS